ncbi:MAG: hypothetical protein WCI89_03435 [bacterium]
MELRELAVLQIAHQYGDLNTDQFDPIKSGQQMLAEAEDLLRKLGYVGIDVVVGMLTNCGVTLRVAETLAPRLVPITV